MKFFSIPVLLCLLNAPAFADEASTAAPSPASPSNGSPTAPTIAAPTKYYFELDQGDLNTIALGLNEVVKRMADSVLLKLNAQIGDKTWQERAAKAKEAK